MTAPAKSGSLLGCLVDIGNVKVPDERVRRLGDVRALAESISKIGQLQPIVITRDMRLVSGLHRLEACRSLGRKTIAAYFIDAEGLQAELAEIDENLIRNELTALERGEHLARRKEIYEALHPETKKGGDRKSDESKRNDFALKSFADETANATGSTARTVQQEVQIASKLAPDVKESIRSTPLANSKVELLELSRMEPERQRAVVERISSGSAKNVHAAKNEIHRSERVEKLAEISRGAKPLDGVRPAPVIYADPPWRYEHVETESRAIENQYPTMSLEEICALGPKIPATADAVLFLWATSPKLAEAMRVLEAWGFAYRTCAVWDKEKIGMGYYFRQQHELLLVATRGTPPTPAPADRPSSVLRAVRGKHSAKPAEFAELIEAMYPELPKVELFCRSPRDGWSAWGNQA